MNFSQSIASGFQNSFNFEDRASRSEYWYWALFCALGGLTAGKLNSFIFHFPYLGNPVFHISLIRLAFLVITYPASLALAVRRLHDVNRSGWWLLISMTIIGIVFPLLMWKCEKGTEGDNRFGSDPIASA
jgi:uncharacterized membrane protein YhaH (DUF805 family)